MRASESSRVYVVSPYLRTRDVVVTGHVGDFDDERS